MLDKDLFYRDRYFLYLDLNKNKTITETQLKTYLIDTLNNGFGYPEYQPWTVGDLNFYNF